MSSTTHNALSSSILSSPAIISRPSTPDHPWRTLLQEVANHLHNLGRIKQALSQPSKTDIQITGEFATWESAWAEWKAEYDRTLKTHGKSSDADLWQIKLLLITLDFKIQTCRESLRAPVNVRPWLVRKLCK